MKGFRIAPLLLTAIMIPQVTLAQGELAAKTQTSASQILCPVPELQWGIGQSLPDPWWSESKNTTQGYSLGLGSSTGPYTTQAQGKEMLACRWADYGKNSYGPWPLAVQIGAPQPANTHIYMMRPLTNTPKETWNCPATVQVRVLTQLPAPWLGTQYQWALTGKEESIAGGAPVNMCQYSGKIPNEILYPIQTTTQAGMAGLVSNPPPAIDQLAQAFLVTKAQLTAIPARRSTSCPTTVRFEGRIGANAAGNVSYRTELNGQPSQVQTLTFTAPGEKVVKFETLVPPAQQQGGGLTLIAEAPSNVHNGQARILIQSPSGVSVSNVASYQITCTPLAPAGNLAQTPLPPEPKAPALAAPTPSSGPAPTAIAAAPQQGRTRPARISQPGAVAPAPATVAAAALALPDLRIAAADLHETRPTMLRVQVVNSGQAGSAATRVRVWTPDGKSWYAPMPALAVGQEIWVVVRADMPLTAAPTIHARVDDPDRVKESDENNNEHKVK
jgi:hypothetical protein